MTPRELMYKFSKGQIKLDEKNTKKLEKLIKSVSNEFLVWWSEFVDKNPDYTHANDSHRPDEDLLDELREYADNNNVRLTATRNNDDLLNTAAALFSSVSAHRAVDFIGNELSSELMRTAEIGQKTYSIKNNKLSSKVINEPFEGVRWSDRIWKHQAELKRDLYRIMRETLLRGDVATGYTKEISDKYGVFRHQADRILRTEAARVSSRQQLNDIKKAGFDKAEWIASVGACHYCRPLDGKTFSVEQFGKEPYVLPKHPNCRCAIGAYYDEDLGIKTKDVEAGSDLNDPVLEGLQKLDGIKPEDLKNIKNIVDNAPKDVQRLYKQFGDGNFENDTRSYYHPTYDKIALTVDGYTKLDGKSGNYNVSYGTIFHELGHKIDYRASFGGVPQSMQHGLQASAKREYRKLVKEKGLDELVNELSFSQEVRGIDDWGGLSDVILGASNGKVDFGVGHYNSKGNPNKAYYSKKLGEEVFANLFEATALNSDGRKLFEKHFPKTTEKFDEIIRGTYEEE